MLIPAIVVIAGVIYARRWKTNVLARGRQIWLARLPEASLSIEDHWAVLSYMQYLQRAGQVVGGYN